MQIGMNNQGKLVHISKAVNNMNYVCPDCHQPLIIKISRTGRKFFAHYYASVKLCGESSEHQLGKKQIFQWAIQHNWKPQLEVYLPEIQQRPDLLLAVNQRLIAIEYQCSPLTIHQIKQRNQGYASQGIDVKWVLGSRYQSKLQAIKVAQFTQQYGNQVFLYFWDSRFQRIRYRSNYATCSYRANRGSVKARLLNQTNRLQRQCSITNSLANLAYQRGHILSCCPLFVHDLNKRWPVMQQPVLEWRIRTLIDMERWPVGKKLTLKTWYRYIGQTAEWLEFPCLDSQMLNQLRYQVINDWQQALLVAGVIQINNQILIYCGPPVWYRNIADKRTEIKRLSGKTGRLFQRMIK